MIAIDELKQFVNVFKNFNGSAADQHFQISDNPRISSDRAADFARNFDAISSYLSDIDRKLINEAISETVWKKTLLDLKNLKRLHDSASESEISYDNIFLLVKSLKVSVGNLFDECFSPSGTKHCIYADFIILILGIIIHMGEVTKGIFRPISAVIDLHI